MAAAGPVGIHTGTRRRGGTALRGHSGELTETCDVVLSVCPPAAALDVAHQVAATGLRVHQGAVQIERGKAHERDLPRR